jgi:hypothetical protein
MKARAAALVAAALVLSGCVSAPPAGLSESELDARHAIVLDRVWANTALEGIVDRPTVAVVATLRSTDWLKQVYTCLGERSVADFGLVFGRDSGFGIIAVDGRTPLSDADQLSFYICTGKYRLDGVDVFADQPLWSRAQLDYIYDYYLQWAVPCLLHNDFAVHYAPSREDFVDSQGRWSPYGAMRDDHSTARAAEICGPELPPL